MRACCVICGELFLHSQDISATLCGHTFHTLCIIQWIERSKSCPQCRKKTIESTLKKLYFDTTSADGEEDPDALRQQIENMKFQFKLKEQELKKATDASDLFQAQAVALREELKSSMQTVTSKETTILALKTQLQFMDRLTNDAKKAKEEAKHLKEQLKLHNEVEHMLKGTKESVDEILMSYTNDAHSLNSLATFCSFLKKELSEATHKNTKLRSQITSLTKISKDAEKHSRGLQRELDTLRTSLKSLEQDKASLENEITSMQKRMNALEQAIASPSDDVRSSALHRLLAESPAPIRLKRLHTTYSDKSDTVTPEVVRKRSPSCAPSQVKVNDVEFMDLASSPTSQKILKNVSSISNRPLSDSINIIKSSTGQHHNIFARVKNEHDGLKKSGDGLRAGALEGYDGMGGHHSVDVFPTPLPRITKKTSSRVAVKHGRGNRTQAKASKITSFLKNTFED